MQSLPKPRPNSFCLTRPAGIGAPHICSNKIRGCSALHTSASASLLLLFWFSSTLSLNLPFYSIMASAAKQAVRPIVPPADLESFTQYLKGCRRIVALLGAGLSASSGLPTFRGAGGLWRTHDATDLATPEAFEENPDLVWQFYSFRRHMALKAAPNRAHYALAELSRKNKDFITLSQNVDGMNTTRILLLLRHLISNMSLCGAY